MDKARSTPKADNQKGVDRSKFASKRRRKRRGFCVKGIVEDDCSAVMLLKKKEQYKFLTTA